MERRMQKSVWSDSDECRNKTEKQGEGHCGSVSDAKVNKVVCGKNGPVQMGTNNKNVGCKNRKK